MTIYLLKKKLLGDLGLYKWLRFDFKHLCITHMSLLLHMIVIFSFEILMISFVKCSFNLIDHLKVDLTLVKGLL